MAPLLIVDVRDMLCAQALAVVAQALGRAEAGSFVDILYNADDVQRDLSAWAKERGHGVSEVAANVLRMVKSDDRCEN